MESNGKTHPSGGYSMKSGDGKYSYTQNSLLQKQVIEAASQFIKKGIAEKLQIESFTSSKTFTIADLGCATGPNTFLAVQNIYDAVKLKENHNKSHGIVFQVCFSDQTSNDFNTLLKSLPPNRPYFASGIPGSFYERLFPPASINIVHSSFSLQWLSRLPENLVNRDSPAFNKGKISYPSSKDDVIKEYATQHAKDSERFLNVRAHEIVHDGLMILNMPGRSNGALHSEVSFIVSIEMLGSCLFDMAKEGLVNEELVDDFNIPIYLTSPEELGKTIATEGHFTVEKLEATPISLMTPGMDIRSRARITSLGGRAAMEGLFKAAFGEEILDELFDRFTKKLEENPSIASTEAFHLFVMLKRRT